MYFMKSLLIFIFLILFVPPQDGHYHLSVKVTGLKPPKGDLYISLHNRPEYFQIADSAFMKTRITVNAETESVLFDGLHEGTYAIAIYHDENLNGILDVNELGIPKEGYAFSTKTKVAGRVKFEQAAFEVNKNDTIEVKMIYHTGAAQKKDTGGQ
jgi:uncharacterized protein (DUF2141 family)